VFESPNDALIQSVRELAISAGMRATNTRAREKHTEFDTKSGHYEYDTTTTVFSITNLDPEELDFHGWGHREAPSCVQYSAEEMPTHTMLERVESINPCGVETVYDISVPGPRNFWADGLFVHNSGPDKYRVGSPGVAEKALTVGAWSLTDDAPSSFSSRGPQGDWYKNNQGVFEDHRSKYGDAEFLTPDVAVPGGGRATVEKANARSELLYQSSTGWYDGLKTGLRDTRSAMKGTSMSTPAAAGLVKRLYDAGIIKTAAEVKQVAREQSGMPAMSDADATAREQVGNKNIAAGWGPLRESMFEPAQPTG
jgi:hypothetical protein